MGAEIWIGTKQGEFGLEEWREQIARFPQFADRAIASAVKSEGSRMQQMIKMSMMLQNLSGLDLAPLSPHTAYIKAAVRRERSRNLRIEKGVKVRKRKSLDGKHQESGADRKPLQRLAGSIRYRYDDSIKTVTVGPLDTKWRGLMKMHAQGFSTNITPRSRRYHFAVGMPLAKGTTQLKTPPRPIIAKIFEMEKNQIVKNVQEKTQRNIYRYLTGKSKEQVEKDWVI
jgi:hypothetical protein